MCGAQLAGLVFHFSRSLAWMQLSLSEPSLYVGASVFAVCLSLADHFGLFLYEEELLGDARGEVERDQNRAGGAKMRLDCHCDRRIAYTVCEMRGLA